MATADTKIFSVAVQQGRSDTSSGKQILLRDVEGQMVDRPVILNKKVEDNSEDESKDRRRGEKEREEVRVKDEPVDTGYGDDSRGCESEGGRGGNIVL